MSFLVSADTEDEKEETEKEAQKDDDEKEMTGLDILYFCK